MVNPSAGLDFVFSSANAEPVVIAQMLSAQITPRVLNMDTSLKVNGPRRA
jgi:hypothetical protein